MSLLFLNLLIHFYCPHVTGNWPGGTQLGPGMMMPFQVEAALSNYGYQGFSISLAMYCWL